MATLFRDGLPGADRPAFMITNTFEPYACRTPSGSAADTGGQTPSSRGTMPIMPTESSRSNLQLVARRSPCYGRSESRTIRQGDELSRAGPTGHASGHLDRERRRLIMRPIQARSKCVQRSRGRHGS